MFDQYYCILFFGFAGSEKQLFWRRVMYILRRRCDRLGPHYASKVRFGYSDLCCEGCQDRTDHWFIRAWPNVTHAPMKDIFHAFQMVTGALSVRGPAHDLHTNFTQELSLANLHFTEDSIQAAVTEYCRECPEVPAD